MTNQEKEALPQNEQREVFAEELRGVFGRTVLVQSGNCVLTARIATHLPTRYLRLECTLSNRGDFDLTLVWLFHAYAMEIDDTDAQLSGRDPGVYCVAHYTGARSVRDAYEGMMLDLAARVRTRDEAVIAAEILREEADERRRSFDNLAMKPEKA